MSAPDSRFTEAWDAVDPFDPTYPHLWVKVEHLGRYLFSASYLASRDADTVVDAGCGRGYGAVELAGACRRVIAIDSDSALVQHASETNPHPRIEYHRVALGTGKLERLGAAIEAVSLVCFETLEHLTDPERALREFWRVLTPGATLILSVPNGVNERVDATGLLTNREHRRIFSVSSITDLLGATGFTVTEVLGQPITNTINSSETRLIRRKQTDGRIGDEPALHEPATIRRLALAVGYPEQRDVERSYSIIVVAKRASD